MANASSGRGYGPGGFVGEVSWLIKLFYTKFLAHAAWVTRIFYKSARHRQNGKTAMAPANFRERESKMKMMGCVAVFGSLAMMQNAVEAFRDLKSVVLGSIDTTFNTCSNGWKLGALGACSSSADGKSNSFVPCVFFLCREEDAVTAVVD